MLNLMGDSENQHSEEMYSCKHPCFKKKDLILVTTHSTLRGKRGNWGGGGKNKTKGNRKEEIIKTGTERTE